MDQSREAHLAARPHHSPEGGQSAALFAADWPPEGNMTSSNTGERGGVAPAIGGGGNARGNARGIAMGVSAPGAARARRPSAGCGACQRSSTRRRRVHHRHAKWPVSRPLSHPPHRPRGRGWQRGGGRRPGRAARPTPAGAGRSAAASPRPAGGWPAARPPAGRLGSRKQGGRPGWWRTRPGAWPGGRPRSALRWLAGQVGRSR
jgi:hypothetical protein